MKKIISIKNVSKNFKKFKLFDNINFDIHEGEKVALCGSNGSGKTTLIEFILGLSKPSSGKVEVNIKRSDIGIQFQDSNFPEGLTTREVIDFFIETGTKVKQDVLNKFLDIFHMKNILNIPAHSLSGGQKQKLNIILACVNEQELFILDELTTGLDILTKNTILNFLKSNTSFLSKSLIIVSHDISEILNLCDRIIFINDKKITYDGKIKEIIKKYGTLEKAFSIFLKIENNKKD